jgi:hypothetical protein
MDKFFPAFFVLLLLAFAVVAAIEACAEREPMRYQMLQDAAVEAGEAEYYVDETGKERWRMLPSR